MNHQKDDTISPADLQALKDFVPGIWDARHECEALWDLEKRTGGVHQVDREGRAPIWQLTDKGRALISGDAEDFELKCPKCGNDGASSDSEKRIQHFEWMPVFRVVEAVEGKTVYLDFDNYHDIQEEAKDPHFFCQGCKHEWAAPNDLTLNSADDYKGKKTFSEMSK